MKSQAKTIPQFLKELEKPDREVVALLDELIRETLPGCAATMMYGMPTYDYHGRMLALNAQKHYFSVYADPELVKKYRAELKHLDVGKSCIRFRTQEAMPLEVLKKIFAEYRR